MDYIEIAMQYSGITKQINKIIEGNDYENEKGIWDVFKY